MASFLDICKLPIRRFQKIKVNKEHTKMYQKHPFYLSLLFFFCQGVTFVPHSQANMSFKKSLKELICVKGS